jgi:hypothetical protein
LSSENINKVYLFCGSYEEKLKTTELSFAAFGNIGFIPYDIFHEFPNLNAITFWKSNLPKKESSLFRSAFAKIRYLYLLGNNIVEVEENAFGELKNLK